MNVVITLAITVVIFVSVAPLQVPARPEGEVVAIIQGFLADDFDTEWRGVERLPAIRWAAQVTELPNCLPDGNCFVRQGAAMIGGRNFDAIAAGARTFVASLYLRNKDAAMGESALLAALRGRTFNVDLARCPVPGTAGGENWYRLHSTRTNPGVLSIQTSCDGKACEAFVVSRSETLPTPQPAQVRLYSEQCSLGSDRKPISAVLPHEALAQALAGLIPSATATSLPDWKAITGIKDIKWLATTPRKTDLTILYLDPNPFSLTGSVTIAGRPFSAIASGSEMEAKVIYLDEAGLHPRGEDVLGVLRTQRFTVEITRCGPVYTDSTNNWYRLTRATTKPVMLKQSISRDGNQVRDSYALRLDGTLPARDSRDRDPGVGGCQ